MHTTSPESLEDHFVFDLSDFRVTLPGGRLILDFSRGEEVKYYMAYLVQLIRRSQHENGTAISKPISATTKDIHPLAIQLLESLDVPNKRKGPPTATAFNRLNIKKNRHYTLVEQAQYDLKTYYNGELIPLPFRKKVGDYPDHTDEYIDIISQSQVVDARLVLPKLHELENQDDDELNEAERRQDEIKIYREILSEHYAKDLHPIASLISVSANKNDEGVLIVTTTLNPQKSPLTIQNFPDLIDIPEEEPDLTRKPEPEEARPEVVVSPLEEQVDRYMSRMTRCLSKLKVDLAEHPAKRNKLYIKRSVKQGGSDVSMRSGSFSEEKIIQDIVTSHKPQRLCLIGDAGSGKTSLLENLVYSLCEEDEGMKAYPERRPIPLLIELEHWNPKEHRELIHFIAEETVGLPPSSIERILHDGRAVLIFDGLDETRSNVGGHERFLSWLNQHLKDEAYCRTHVLISSRPWAATAPAFNALEFQTLQIDPLSVSDQHDYIHSFFEDVPSHMTSHIPSTDRFYRPSQCSKPGFLMLFCTAHARHNEDEPKPKLDLVETALQRTLTQRNFLVEPGMAILSHLAWSCWQAGSSRISAIQAHKVLGDSVHGTGVLASYSITEVANLFEELCDQSDILHRNKYGIEFTDQLYLEYLAARHLADSATNNDLLQTSIRRHIWNPVWREVLDFAIRRLWHIDPKLAEQYVEWLLREIEEGKDDVWHSLMIKAATWAMMIDEIRDLDPKLVSTIVDGATDTWKFNVAHRNASWHQDSKQSSISLNHVLHRLVSLGYDSPLNMWIQELKCSHADEPLFIESADCLAQTKTKRGIQALVLKYRQTKFPWDQVRIAETLVDYLEYCPKSLILDMLKVDFERVRYAVISRVIEDQIDIPSPSIEELLNDADLYHTVAAIKILARQEGNMAVQRIFPYLQDNQDPIRDAAAEAIRQMGIETAWPLLKSMPDAPSQQYIQLLADIQEPEALSLIKESCSKPDEEVRLAGIAALCDHSDLDADEKISLLHEMSDDPSDAVRERVNEYKQLYGLSTYSNQNADRQIQNINLSQTDEAIMSTALSATIKSKKPADQIKFDLRDGLNHSMKEKYRNQCCDAIAESAHLDVEPLHRTTAILYYLFEQDAESFTQTLFQLLHRSDSERAAEIMSLLSSLGSKKSRILRDHLPPSDRVAIRSAVRFQCIDALKDFIADPSCGFRDDIAHLLEVVEEDRSEQLLIQMLDDPDELVLKTVCHSLSEKQSRNAIDKLRMLLDHNSSGVRLAAAEALASMGDASAIDVISDDLIEEARTALTNREDDCGTSGSLISRTELLITLKADISHLIDTLIDLSEGADPFLQTRVLDALTLTDSPKAIGLCHNLFEIYANEGKTYRRLTLFFRVKRALLYASRIKAKELVPDMIKVLQQAPDTFIEYPCVQAITDILGDDSIPLLMGVFEQARKNKHYAATLWIVELIAKMGTHRSYECIADLVAADKCGQTDFDDDPIESVNKREFLPFLIKRRHESANVDRLIGVYCDDLELTILEDGQICAVADHQIDTDLPPHS